MTTMVDSLSKYHENKRVEYMTSVISNTLSQHEIITYKMQSLIKTFWK